MISGYFVSALIRPDLGNAPNGYSIAYPLCFARYFSYLVTQSLHTG